MACFLGSHACHTLLASSLQWIFWIKTCINSIVLCHTEVPHLPDTQIRLHKQYGDMLGFILAVGFCHTGENGYQGCPLGGILSVCKTLEQLHGLETVTRPSISKVVSSQRWHVYPLKQSTGDLMDLTLLLAIKLLNKRFSCVVKRLTI